MWHLLVNLYIKLNFLLFSLQSWQQSLQRLSKHNLFRGKWKQWHSKRNLGKKFVLWLGEYVDNNCFDDTSGYLGTFPISNKTMSWTSKKVFWTSKHNWSDNLHHDCILFLFATYWHQCCWTSPWMGPISRLDGFHHVFGQVRFLRFIILTANGNLESGLSFYSNVMEIG